MQTGMPLEKDNLRLVVADTNATLNKDGSWEKHLSEHGALGSVIRPKMRTPTSKQFSGIWRSWL